MALCIVLCALIVKAQNIQTPAIFGEWRIWRITMGDCLQDPPTQLGKLFLKADGTFTWHTKELHRVDDARGTYRFDGNQMTFKGVATSNWMGQIEKRTDLNAFLYRKGMLWDGAYVMGCGSCVITRPGTKPPEGEKNWPSISEVFNGWRIKSRANSR